MSRTNRGALLVCPEILRIVMQAKKHFGRVLARRVFSATVLFWLALWLGLFLKSPAMAQGLDRGGDYLVEVAVNGQDPAEEASAQRVALRIILLGKSATKTLLNTEGMRRALLSAQEYIIESDYRVPGAEDRITRSTPITAKVRKSGEATHILAMRFDAAAISSLIAEQSALEELDPDARPAPVPNSALAWLLIDDGNAEHRIGGTTGRNVIERSKEIAGGVGQVILFPEQDSTDQQAISADDLRSGNQQQIQSASARYQQSIVLTGILKRSIGRGWTADWSRYYDDQIDDQSYEATSLDQALQQGIAWLAALRDGTEASTGSDNSAAATSENRSAYQPLGARSLASANEALLWVGRVASAEAYATIVQLIEDIDSVDLVYPKQVQQDGIFFSVSPRSAINDVTQSLAGVNWVAPAPSLGGTGVTQSADAYYEYLR